MPHKFKVTPLTGDVPSSLDAPHCIILLVSCQEESAPSQWVNQTICPCTL